MSIRFEHIGNLSNMSTETWELTSKQHQGKFIILTQNQDIYACVGRDDLEGEVKTIQEIAQLVHERNKYPHNSDFLKEKEVVNETKSPQFNILKNEQQGIQSSLVVEKKDFLSIASSSFNPLLSSQWHRDHYLKSVEDKPWVKDFQEFQIALEGLLSLKDISQEVESFVKSYEKKYNLSLADFEPLYIDQSNTPYVKEKLLNIVLNTHKNDEKIREFIEGKKESIIAEFAPIEYQKTGKEHFQVEIELKGKETHNGGKLPAKVTFSIEGNQIFSVMYKPRAAAIDRSVQELLATFKMPSYTIISYPDENKSIWSYIDGEDMLLSLEERHVLRYSSDYRLKGSQGEGPRRTPEAFIRYSITLKENLSKQTTLLKKLERLNKILLCMNITDLHGENVRLGKDGNIYPIDLEVLDSRQSTLLMIDDYRADTQESRNKAWNELSSDEQHLVKDWNAHVLNQSHEFTIPVRHVLVSTGDLFQIRFITNVNQATETMLNMVIKALETRGYEYNETQKNIIKNQISMDLLNGDVPFFTEFKENIYYGYANEGHLIGKRRPK